MTLTRRADPLRFIAVRLGVPDLDQVVRVPGVGEAYRVTVQYHDGRHPDQIGTLVYHGAGGGSVTLSVHYRRAVGSPLVLTPTITLDRWRAFSGALRALKFDTLDDLPDIPWYGADLWLIERASGAFQHNIVIAPERALELGGVYAQIVSLVREHLRETVRAING